MLLVGGYPRDTGVWKRLRCYKGGGHGVAALGGSSRAVSPRIAQRKWKTLHPRSALTAPALNNSVSAPPLQLHSSPPLHSVSRSGRCSASACAPQDECRGGKWGGRWGRGAYNRLPGGSTQQKEFHINAPLYWATARRHLSWKQKRRFIDPHCDR